MQFLFRVLLNKRLEFRYGRSKIGVELFRRFMRRIKLPGIQVNISSTQWIRFWSSINALDRIQMDFHFRSIWFPMGVELPPRISSKCYMESSFIELGDIIQFCSMSRQGVSVRNQFLSKIQITAF